MKAARGSAPKPPKEMNRLEAAYATHLFGQKHTRQVLEYGYEKITLKLADDCRYTPDFFVIAADGEWQFHEVKGEKVWEDSIVKLKVASAIFPFLRFFLVTRSELGWKVEPY